jgi:hypothetical protein
MHAGLGIVRGRPLAADGQLAGFDLHGQLVGRDARHLGAHQDPLRVGEDVDRREDVGAAGAEGAEGFAEEAVELLLQPRQRIEPETRHRNLLVVGLGRRKLIRGEGLSTRARRDFPRAGA